ncbi:MAG: phosphoenolpyruvate synthase [Rikenellaceae bacterium]|nr:phosphoenolpyruvate synthase [Rikenellaceae bacterium]
MIEEENIEPGTDYRSLMQKRIKSILLICSSYDAYILEEDGHIESQINSEYMDLNLSNPPSFTRVTTTDEALAELEKGGEFDLVISMYNVGERDVFSSSRTVKEMKPDLPFILLTSFSRDITEKIESQDRSAIDYIFFWYGSADLILAIIKLIEDRMNADDDILRHGVQSILLVEDSVRYYSTYLPAIYKLVLTQSNEFLKEALNEQQQMLRKRARPKILLATNLTEAVELCQRYKENLLGVISDVGFVVDKNDPPQAEKLDAGIELCRLIKKDDPYMPFLLQSSQESMRGIADQLGVGFLVKYSKTLIMELSEYISSEFRFGDFVFSDLETGEPIARAHDLRQMEKLLAEIPDEVLIYHASQNHLSKWLYSRGLFSIAAAMKKRPCDSFTSPREMRDYIRGTIRDYRILLGQGVVAKFDPDSYNEAIGFARIGNGSLGGKARGLAFFNSMLQKYKFYDKYPGVRVLIPRTVVIATAYFARFIKENGLKYVINADVSDEEILSEFVSSRLPEDLIGYLRRVIKYIRGPLAIRSSSKLEDSHYQPFAGIYSTYMIPDTDNPDQMLRLLGKAIKSVYASVYFAASRAYITASANLLSEEKMAIVIQQVCGTEDNGYYFPTLSGVARSLNFYPIGDEKPGDGIANIAFGLGKLVVEGGQTLRFSPRYPKNVLQLSQPELALRDTQREMYALSLQPEEFKTSIDDAVNLRRFDINSPTVKAFRNLRHAASTWDMQNQSLSDSSFTQGRKIITFSRILKYDTFPLAEILCDLLEMGEREMRTPVEMEFAVNMDVPLGREAVFNFLQIRPVVDPHGTGTLDWSTVDTSRALLYSDSALGIGAIEGVKDIIYIKTGAFQAKDTEKMAVELRKLNAALAKDETGYVLVGTGRWGSSDPWLGIPVRWPDISQARVIVEMGLEDFRVEPSQGTHFFQNLTSFGVGYMTINPFSGDGRFDAAALDAMPASWEGEYFRRVTFPRDLYIFVDGRNDKAVVAEEEGA